METKISTFRRIYTLRNGTSRTIKNDREYLNSEFGAFYDEMECNLIPVSANDHEGKGLIENANKTLRSFYNLLRLCDQSSTPETICAEAVYGKKISVESKIASEFELLSRRPH